MQQVPRSLSPPRSPERPCHSAPSSVTAVVPKQTSHFIAEARRIAERLRGASDGLAGPEAFLLGEDLLQAIDGLRLALARGAGRPRPTHFVGLRMPPLLRERLEAVQARLLARDPSLAKASVSMAKSHVTLIVTLVEPGRESEACDALEAAAAAWRAAEGAVPEGEAPLCFWLHGLGFFAHNGVLFAEMGPVDLLRALRGHVVHAFAERGFVALDEKDLEEDAGAAEGEGREQRRRESSDCEASDDEDIDKGDEDGVDDADTNPTGAPTASTTAGQMVSAGGKRSSNTFSPHVTLFKASQAGRGKGQKKQATAAKKAVVRMGKSLPAGCCGVAGLDFGQAPLAVTELVDMRNTQADGFYEILCEAVLGHPLSAEAPSAAAAAAATAAATAASTAAVFATAATVDSPPSADVAHAEAMGVECAQLQPGEAVLVKWGGEWHAATVEKQMKGNRIRVTYDEDGSFELVPKGRLRRPIAASANVFGVGATGAKADVDVASVGEGFAKQLETLLPARAPRGGADAETGEYDKKDVVSSAGGQGVVQRGRKRAPRKWNVVRKHVS